MTQDDADKYMAITTYIQNNPEDSGVSVGDQYVVTDENGTELGHFDTQEEANNYAYDNPAPGIHYNFVENYVWSDSVGGDTGTGTVGEFDNFSTNEIPPGNEWLDQEAWVSMGSPETWADVEKAMEKNPVYGIYGDHDGEGVYNAQGNVQYSDEELKTVYRAIRDGDAFAIGKYGLAEDSSVNSFGELAANGEYKSLSDPHFTYHHDWESFDWLERQRNDFGVGSDRVHIAQAYSQSGENLLPITEADVNANIGKVMTMPDGTQLAIGGYKEYTYGQQVMQIIHGVNPRTGKNEIYAYLILV